MTAIACAQCGAAGDDRLRVARVLRAAGGRPPEGWDAPPLPGKDAPPGRFATTIADLGEFAADDYATRLDAWCRATLSGWGLDLITTFSTPTNPSSAQQGIDRHPG